MPTIALVDDDRNSLTSVSMTLESEGFRVTTYNDGSKVAGVLSPYDGLSRGIITALQNAGYGKAGVPMPALFERDENGREGLVNFRQQGGFIVIDGVPNTLVMRLGKDTAVLVNRHPLKEQNLRVAER